MILHDPCKIYNRLMMKAKDMVNELIKNQEERDFLESLKRIVRSARGMAYA